MDRLKEIIESHEAEEQYIKEFWDNDIDSIEPEEVPIKESNLKRVKDTITYLKELQRYKDLEEQGRLIELPCKVGDTVYKVCNNAGVCYECEHFEEPGYETDEYCKIIDDYDERYFPQIAETPRCEKQHFHIVERKATEDILLNNLKWFGNIYFTTKEEAEAKLKEMEGTQE